MIQIDYRRSGIATTALGLAVLAAIVAMAPADRAVAQARSAYSSTAPERCRVSSAATGVDDSTIRVCPGPNGLIVLISEDDLRETVSVGRTRKAAAAEPAAQVWFGPFNSTTNTVEWRLDARARPFALIQRWHIADNDDPDKEDRPRSRQLLVVTRLAPGPVCHVGYVDVTANPNANELARKAADDNARDFRCGVDTTKIVGAGGRAVDLVRQR